MVCHFLSQSVGRSSAIRQGEYFGGSMTLGWVNEGLGGTLEGDLQGLGKILRFIETGEGPPGRISRLASYLEAEKEAHETKVRTLGG